VQYTDEQRLPAAIAKTGNRIEEVKAIVIGHLHNDHAGNAPIALSKFRRPGAFSRK
jgi:glyoxylase-like metal-dependent hydrolase (beta-lactamase superfamily II)